MKQRSTGVVMGALGFTFLVPVLGYWYLGTLLALIFLVGYLAGFMLWCWSDTWAPWKVIRVPYWLTLAAFLALHKVEENRMAFFETVSEKITGIPVPEISVGLIVALLVVPVGAWLAAPLLLRRNRELGRYLAWTFFASMGFTELAHFAMPVLAQEPYGYFPGMASVVVLSPLAWWGMWRLHQGRVSQSAVPETHASRFR